MKHWRIEITDLATYLGILLPNAAVISLIGGGPTSFFWVIIAVVILDIVTVIFGKLILVRWRT